jgi:hypothetical protein
MRSLVWPFPLPAFAALWVLWRSVSTVVATSSPTRKPTATPTYIPNYDFHPPDCLTNETDIAYINGMISATQTFYNCLANVADPLNIPILYNGSVHGTMIINTSIQLNNLQDIDAVASTASLDFYLRLYWEDPR